MRMIRCPRTKCTSKCYSILCDVFDPLPWAPHREGGGGIFFIALSKSGLVLLGPVSSFLTAGALVVVLVGLVHLVRGQRIMRITKSRG